MKYGMESKSAVGQAARVPGHVPGITRDSLEQPAPVQLQPSQAFDRSCQLRSDPLQGAAHEVRSEERERLGQAVQIPGHCSAGIAQTAFSTSRLSTDSAVTEYLPVPQAGSCA